MKTAATDISQVYRRIARTLPLLAERADWKDAAAAAGLSPYYFQRLFKRYVGVSPKQYTACLALSDIKQRLAAGESVLSAALAEGLSGGGRAHDLFISIDATTPGEFAGAPLSISYGLAQSPFGGVFIAATARGICLLQFVHEADRAGQCAAFVAQLKSGWEHARLRQDNRIAGQWAVRVFTAADTPLHIRGTNFQIKVWQALLSVAAGQVVSYRALAQAVTGRAASARAVAGAAAVNPVAVLIPCHRLLGADGALAGYRWGLERKRALLASEFAAAQVDCGLYAAD